MRALSLSGLKRFRDLGMLVARGVPGVIFFYHGYQRLAEEGGVDGFAGFLDMQGVPLSGFFAWVVTLGEIVGGILLILGLLSRLVSVSFIVHMILAIAIVKLEVGLIAPFGGGPGAELDLALIAAMAAVAVHGAGAYSADNAFRIDRAT